MKQTPYPGLNHWTQEKSLWSAEQQTLRIETGQTTDDAGVYDDYQYQRKQEIADGHYLRIGESQSDESIG
jgi:hypothetical protein